MPGINIGLDTENKVRSLVKNTAGLLLPLEIVSPLYGLTQAGCCVSRKLDTRKSYHKIETNISTSAPVKIRNRKQTLLKVVPQNLWWVPLSRMLRTTFALIMNLYMHHPESCLLISWKTQGKPFSIPLCHSEWLEIEGTFCGCEPRCCYSC